MLSTSDKLPTELYTSAEVRALDAAVIAKHGVPGIQLMLRASRVLFATLASEWPHCNTIQLFCGKGNNAGDAYLLAALAKERGYSVALWQVGPAPASGDALLACERAKAAGVEAKSWNGELPAAGVIVDGLLGTGLSGEVRPAFAEAIAAINASELPVLAVDVPSGLCADTGCALGEAVSADVSLSFIGLKRGLFTADAKNHCGKILFSDLQAPPDIIDELPVTVRRLALQEEIRALPRRRRTAHKGHFGHVVVVGGDRGMGGAAILAVTAAARSGAGLVSCATRAEHIPALLAIRPEVMALAAESAEQLDPLLEKATVIVVGPGLGQSVWGRYVLTRVLATSCAKIIDADALNLIAEGELRWTDGDVIITPHPGEAARLLQCSTADIHHDRYAAALALRERYQATVVLKGAGTIVADEQGMAVCSDGNPGMASGGMGDVLSGVLGALLAQGLSTSEAARLSVCVHACAADRAALQGERGLLASDVTDQLRALLN
ncbi:MAG: hydroxyethylthiazole kinase-like uncharacterized protein yjeF [Bermanella sp.]|jgi:hydroxyethylthiazole kinase-like uncharacterized protein yjeF